ncbi:MAG: class SAM-dependent methyltransferase [Solirubrobacterales bacterium]|jgi:SAM-dependent methyltransferase|nr:class SAM-dependent methyltransferase [Solirubrobacterales bacterium]
MSLSARAATALRLRAHDALDRARGRNDPLIPPRRLQFVGAGDFAAVGDEFLGHLVDLAGLTPRSDVLDIGCGIGRVARPLAGYLDADGSYAGFDVDPRGIEWCAARYPADRFSFALADLHNLRYNPTGTQSAREYRFPYADDAFDVALMTSVVTHLQAPEAGHYLAEAIRVLRPGGRLLATFFLLDDESRAAMRAQRTSLTFQHPDEEVAVADPALPEEAVAYDERWVRERLDVHSIEPGTWRGKPSASARSYQDIVIACA